MEQGTRTITGASARVAQTNTPETDAMSQVMHNVTLLLSDGSELNVPLMAECPMDAIEKARKSFKG